MNGLIMDNETAIRLTAFIGTFLVLALWEIRYPRRVLRISKKMRWANNWAIGIINATLLKLIFPLMGVGLSLLAQERHWGLLNYLTFPQWVEVLFFIVLFDFVIYLQHRFFHLVPVLRRLHRVHHIDRDIDVTTGNRFHPLSIVLSMIIKLSLVVVAGPSAIAVLLAEMLLNVTSLFNHSNIYLPPTVDRVLRLLVVTPDMHRVHHSVNDKEHNCNFGFNFPWWDHLFGTYLSQPVDGHLDMDIGIRGFENDKSFKLHWMLIHPFLSDSKKPSDSIH